MPDVWPLCYLADRLSASNFEPRVTRGPCQQYGRQIITIEAGVNHVIVLV